jgi:hypothetical protein
VPKGKCKGCLIDDIKLQRSHLIPASVYRLLDSPNAPNRNPILITSHGNVQTSRAICDYLLCGSCEQILCRDGEQWVAPRLATRDRTFPLHDILTTVAPDVIGLGVRAYAGAKNARLRVKDLTHFALGIFWKASVHSWKSGPSSIIPRIELGPYGESVRSFLFCSGPFPEHVRLGVNVMPAPVATMLSYQPCKGIKSNGIHHFSFYLPGVLFALSAGKGVTEETENTCFYGNPLHPLLIKDISEEVERYPREIYFKGKAAMALRGTKRSRPVSPQ